MPIAHRLAPLVLGVLLLPGAGLAAPQEPPVRRVDCGHYRAVPSGFHDRTRQATRLLIERGGRLLVTVTDWAITSAQCEALAPGAPNLLVRTYSGGAHCCETLRVYTLGDSPRLVLVYAANTASGYQVRDVDKDGRKELLLGDDTFAYFDDLDYASSPASLPLVACFTEGRFEDCTTKHPDLLRAERDRRLVRLEAAAAAGDTQAVEGSALALVALSILLGDEKGGLQSVESASPGDALQAWLAKALPQVRDWAAARGRKLKPGDKD